MSLIHWWPLNGDTKDYGCGTNLTLTNKGSAAVSNNGKIGKTYDLTAGKSLSVNTTEFNSSQNISVSYWLKLNESPSGNWWDIFQISVFRAEIYNSNLLWTGYSGEVGSISGTEVPLNTWIHFTHIYNATNHTFALYKNGVLVNSRTVSDYSATSSTILLGEGNLNINLNDFRIYNHALSVKEIREISKGLMLHYNFEDPALSRNLLTTNSSSSYINLNAVGNYSILASSTTNFGLSAGDTYCWSVYVKVPTTTKTLKARVQFYNDSSSRVSDISNIAITNGEGLTYISGTVRSGYAEMELIIDYNSSSDISTRETCYFKFAKLEKGRTTPTVWTSNSEPQIVYDNSGYNNNATVYGTDGVQILSGSPSGANYVHIPFTSTIRYLTNNFDRTDALTYSIWFRHYGLGTDNWTWLFTNGRADATGYGYGVRISSDTQIRCYWAQRSEVAVDVPKEEWHLLTVSITGLTQTIYLDGVQKATGTAASLPTYENGTGLGLGCFYYNTTAVIYRSICDIADFKIYATALSSSDIMLEYNRKASIDKNGNIYSGEFSQTANNISLPTKTGIVKANHFVEGGSKTSLQESYTELEYISFSGTSSAGQFIRTGITTLTHPFSVRTVYNKTNTETRDQSLVGQRGLGKYPNIYYNTYETVYVRTDNYTAPDNIKTSVEIRSGTGVLRDNEVIYSTNNTDNKSSNYELLIGAFSETDYTEAKWFYSGNIYEITIISNDILIRDFIPAKRKSDNTLGLYDIVNKQFYTNQGTGTFTAGPELNKLNVIYTNQLIEN